MNPSNYCTLPIAKSLHEAGLKLVTEKCWYYDDPVSHDDIAKGVYGEWKLVDFKTDYPAPNLSEVWRELPDYIDKGNHRYRKELYWDGGVTHAWYGGLIESKYRNINPTDAACLLLLWVKGGGR